MDQPRRPGHARVVFDDVLWNDDLAHNSSEAVRVARSVRRILERNGARIDELRACQDLSRISEGERPVR